MCSMLGARWADASPNAASAQPIVRASGTILIVRVAGDEEVVARLRAELASKAWRVIELSSGAEEAALSELAAQHNATAALRCDLTRGLELWVESATAASAGTLETLEVGGESREPGVLTWRVTEALRARGLRFSDPGRDSAPVSAEPESPSPPRPRPSEQPPRRSAAPGTVGGAAEPARKSSASSAARHLWFELGPAYVWSPGGVAGSVDAWGAVRFDAARWSLSAVALVPLLAPNVARVEGEARVSTFAAAVAADIDWARMDAFRFSSGLGLGQSATIMSGTARAGYVASTDTEWLPVAFARSGLRLAIGNSMAVGARALFGATARQVSIQFGDRSVASWGQPWLAGAVFLEVSPSI